jgi:hypothetical protein
LALAVACIGAGVVPARGYAQSSDPADPPPLFRAHEPLVVTLTADISALLDDRRESPDRPATLTVVDADGARHDVGAEVRTRGEFRLDPANCAFPPLRIDVDRSDAVGTVFESQDDLKLVASCRPGLDAYEQLVRAEYLAYRMYQEVSEQAFRVRLLELTLVDASGENPPQTRGAFLIEEDDVLADRLGATIFDLEEGKNLPPDAFEPVAATTNAVFQYMIGNTDWSDIAGHNVEILERDGIAIVVPYDFDFSGLVDAPYSAPAPDLGLTDVRERRYRGWCANPVTTRAVLDRFRAAQARVLDLWASDGGLEDDARRRGARYLEAFFDAIETDERAQRRFLRDCRRAEDRVGDVTSTGSPLSNLWSDGTS